MRSAAPTTRGQRIASRRNALGLTRMQLAGLCRCHVRTIDRVESDSGAAITAGMIEALRKHLGMPRRELGEAARRGRGA